jgi:hypothetical protein
MKAPFDKLIEFRRAVSRGLKGVKLLDLYK